MTHTLTPPRPDSLSFDPVKWWRFPCEVLPWLFVSGDLETQRPVRATAQLLQWLDLGITDIVDVRIEYSDERFVKNSAPEIAYHYCGTDDDGHGQSDQWFDAVVRAATEARSNPEAKLIVHCHMGVNRAPSAALAIMLAEGYDVVEALDLIRSARPIAAILYAEDALNWWHRRNGTTPEEAAIDHARAAQWFEQNPVDVAWIISRIRLAECA